MEHFKQYIQFLVLLFVLALSISCAQKENSELNGRVWEIEKIVPIAEDSTSRGLDLIGLTLVDEDLKPQVLKIKEGKFVLYNTMNEVILSKPYSEVEKHNNTYDLLIGGVKATLSISEENSSLEINNGRYVLVD